MNYYYESHPISNIEHISNKLLKSTDMAMFEEGESKVTTLVFAADSIDNLCRMDPAWYPWLWSHETITQNVTLAAMIWIFKLNTIKDKTVCNLIALNKRLKG